MSEERPPRDLNKYPRHSHWNEYYHKANKNSKSPVIIDNLLYSTLTSRQKDFESRKIYTHMSCTKMESIIQLYTLQRCSVCPRLLLDICIRYLEWLEGKHTQISFLQTNIWTDGLTLVILYLPSTYTSFVAKIYKRYEVCEMYEH